MKSYIGFYFFLLFTEPNEPNQIYGHVHADCEKMMQTQPQARIERSHSTHTTAAVSMCTNARLGGCNAQLARALLTLTISCQSVDIWYLSSACTPPELKNSSRFSGIRLSSVSAPAT